MKQRENGFTIGEHIENNIKYEFRLANRKYSIVKSMEEESEVIFTSPNSEKSYEEWNKIKRPERVKSK